MITSLYLLWSRFVSWNNRRVTIKRLSALNDHLLKDIGLERNEIHRVASDLAASHDREFVQSEPNRQTIRNHAGLITPIPLPGAHR